MKELARDFGLNLLFILLLPLVLSAFTQSTWVLLFYVLVYAYIETCIDVGKIKHGETLAFPLNVKKYLTTLAVNIGIIYAVSFVIVNFSAAIPMLLATLAVIAVASWIETKIDSRMQGKKIRFLVCNISKKMTTKRTRGRLIE